MPTVMEMRRTRMSTVNEMRAMLQAAEKEARDLSAEETQRYNSLENEVDSLGTRIEREERQQTREREIAGAAQPGIRPTPGDTGTESRAREELRRFLLGGAGNISGNEHRLTASPHELSLFEAVSTLREEARTTGADVWERSRPWQEVRSYAPFKAEHRALQADADTAGGDTVPPQDFIARLIQAIDDTVFIRRFATVVSLTSADSIGFPSLDADPADADWTTELLTGGADSTMAFGKREMRPHPVAKSILVSRKLLRTSALGIEALVRARFAYKFGITEEKVFLTGSGAQQPLGLFTASASGIPTTRDVSTDNTTTAVTADGLINALYSLKEGYQSRSRWLFHRDAVKMIRKLKDGGGQYLWQPGLAGGQPSTILDRPYTMSEYVPNTFTTGLYVGLVGDLSYYWIADALSFEMQRLNELKAETNQVEFIARMELDGAPVLGEAFARVKLA